MPGQEELSRRGIPLVVQFKLLFRLGIDLRDDELVVERHLDGEAFLQLFELGLLVVQGDLPSRSAWIAVASSTVIPQMGSLFVVLDSFMVMFLFRVLL